MCTRRCRGCSTPPTAATSTTSWRGSPRTAWWTTGAGRSAARTASGPGATPSSSASGGPSTCAPWGGGGGGGGGFRGADRIRAWSDAEFIGKRVTLDVRAVERRGGETVVTAQVGGNGFNGPSHFAFLVDGDLVSRMTIRA